jgi:hypothetical protein
MIVLLSALGGQAHHDPGEDAIVAPALPAVIEGLCQAIFPRGVAPSQPVAVDEDYAAEHAPIINTRRAMALRGKRAAGVPSARPNARKGCSSFSLLAEAEARKLLNINGS